MQKQEFEDLTGMKVTDEVFNHAEAIYLNAGSMTKEAVCREIMEHRWLLESPVVAALTETANAMTKLAHKRADDIEKLKDVLLDACGRADYSDVIWNVAAEVIGRATCIFYKFEKGIELNAADIDYIKDNLC